MELVDTVNDKLGRPVKVYFTQALTLPGKVTTFFLRAWAELIENGHTGENYVESLRGKRIHYIEVDDRIVAIQVWEWHNSTAYVAFTFIDRDYRKTGLYKILFDSFDKWVIQNGATHSRIQIHATNTTMLNATISRGYEIEYYRVVKRY